MKRHRVKHLKKLYNCVHCGKHTSLAYGGTSYCRSCISKMRKGKRLKSNWLRRNVR